MKKTTFELPLPITRGNGEPLRTQVLRELRTAVQSGRLQPGSVLPSTRVLAADLGVSRGLVVEAYEQLIAEGYLSARHGSATRVADRGIREGRRSDPGALVATAKEAAIAPQWRYDFRPGIPDLSLFPRRAWLRALRRALAEPAASLDYPDAHGAFAARWALAAYLNRSRATVADAEQVVLCTGFAQGIRLVAEVLRARGVRRIAVEDPGHVEQCADVRAARIELVPVPVDNGGLRVDRLSALDVGALVVTPAHQYPTGAVLAPERRAALLEWAAARRTYIVEDDYDAEYRYDREPVGTLQGLAPDRIVYMGSASKMLAPSLRQGWMVIPVDLVGDVRSAKRSADRGSPVLEQLALAVFLERGELDRHLRRTRSIYRRRRDTLTAALRAQLLPVQVQGVAAGLHLLVSLPDGTDEARVVAAAARGGVRIYGARAYYADAANAAPALLLGYGGVAEADIPAGITALASAIRG